MVFLALFLVVIPLVAAGGQDDGSMMQQQMMQQMMQMMQKQQGWGGNHGGNMGGNNGGNMGGNMGGNNGGNMGGGTDGEWWGAQKGEDYEAYMKWCEERTMAMQEQKQQQEMLEQFQKAEESRRMETEKTRVHKEIEERRESMMAQWKMWQMRLGQQHEFDNLMEKFAEMKHTYMFAVTMEFLKFCKCSDFTEELQRYFLHGDMKYEGGDDWDLDDLEGIDTTNAVEVARVIANKSRTEQVKAFYGGLATSMCMAGRAYVEQVKSWENTYKFLDHLM